MLACLLCFAFAEMLIVIYEALLSSTSSLHSSAITRHTLRLLHYTNAWVVATFPSYYYYYYFYASLASSIMASKAWTLNKNNACIWHAAVGPTRKLHCISFQGSNECSLICMPVYIPLTKNTFSAAVIKTYCTDTEMRTLLYNLHTWSCPGIPEYCGTFK